MSAQMAAHADYPHEPNVELLNRTLAHVEEHPEEWTQQFWRCGTAACFFGHAALLAGLNWVSDDENNSAYDCVTYQGLPVHVTDAAQELLGLNNEDASELSFQFNDLSALRDIVTRLVRLDREGAES